MGQIVYKDGNSAAGSMAPKMTQRQLAVKYGDYLKAHPENIKYGEPDEYGDQDLIWDEGRGFLDSIGFKGTHEDWKKENPNLGLYLGYINGIERNDPERVEWLKKNGKDWYWSLGFDDVEIDDNDMDRIERYYASGNEPDVEALRQRRKNGIYPDPAVQKLKAAGWSDERIAAAEKGIKEKHPEKALGSKSRFAQQYPDRFEKIKSGNYNIYGKGRTYEDVDWDSIAEMLGIKLK